ncbi:MAG: hypothetical protein NC213_07630 [Acetobacter sp.]|nr:hypothetical protein [Bacteroides sp.]MCM1341600.1 hypothetical protein [Acetobacter sp.]MCM1434079.1 hypothetical protein [Clostridiales bacterium]
MNDREKTAREIISKASKQWDEIEKQISNQPKLIETNRKSKSLVRTPDDVDFEMKDGNTTYEVVSHFNSNGDEYFLNQIIRKLGYKN